MNRIISRLLTLLAAFLMLTSVAACKQYPERINFEGTSTHYRWPVEFGVISLNKVAIFVLGHGTASINLPPNDDIDKLSIDMSWSEFHSGRSFKASFEVPISKLYGVGYQSGRIFITVTVGRHGEIIVMGPYQENNEKPEILRLCGKRTPENDASFTDELEYLAANTNFNDPKRLALPLPDSSCPDPGH